MRITVQITGEMSEVESGGVGSGKWGSGKWEVGSGKWEVGSGKWVESGEYIGLGWALPTVRRAKPHAKDCSHRFA
jgi:hypothetical protein